MATCLDGDAFYLDASGTYSDLPTFDGCYIDSGYNLDGPDMTLYSRGGYFFDDEPAVLATDNYGTATWVLALHKAAEGLFYHRCRDADGNDATLIHPTEVTQWNCLDGGLNDFTILDAVTTTCGCTAPSPTAAPISPEPTPTPSTPATSAPLASTVAPLTPTPQPVDPVAPPTLQPSDYSSCGATESFQIVSEGLAEVEGCFQATNESFLIPGATIEIWSVRGNIEFGQIAVVGYAADGAGEVTDPSYSLMYYAEMEDDQIWYCLSNEEATMVHPADATWKCDISGTGSFVNVTNADISFVCGCRSGPFPVSPDRSPSTPSHTPPPPSTTLWGVILGAVGGAAFLALLRVVVDRRRRDNTANRRSRTPSRAGTNLPIAPRGGENAAAVAGGKSGPVPHPLPPASSDILAS